MVEPRVVSQVHVCCECGRMYAAGGFKGLNFYSTTDRPAWIQEQYEHTNAWLVESTTEPCECGCEWFERATLHEAYDEGSHPGYVGEQP